MLKVFVKMNTGPIYEPRRSEKGEWRKFQNGEFHWSNEVRMIKYRTFW